MNLLSVFLNLLNFYQNKYPTGRYGHASIIKNNEFFVFGGKSQKNIINRTCLDDATGPTNQGIWKYNFDSKKWKFKNFFIPGRSGTKIVSNDKYYFLHGGGISNNKSFIPTALNDSWISYNFNNWYKICDGPNIFGHATCIDKNNNIYSIGGFIDSKKSSLLFKYNNSKWLIYNTPLKPIYGHSSIMIYNKIYVIGGYFQKTSDKKNYNNYIWEFDVIKNRWKKFMKFKKMQGHSVTVYNNKIIISGGFYPKSQKFIKGLNDSIHLDGTLSNIYEIDLDKKSYKNIYNLKHPREFHTSNIYKNKLIIWGGYNLGNFYNDFEIFNLKN